MPRQRAHGGVVLPLGVVQFAVQANALLVQLAAALFGGRDGNAVFGQRVDDACGVRSNAGRPAAARRRSARQLGEIALRRVDRRLQFRKLGLQRPQLASPRDQTGRNAPRADRQRSVGFEQFAGKRNVAQA